MHLSESVMVLNAEPPVHYFMHEACRQGFEDIVLLLTGYMENINQDSPEVGKDFLVWFSDTESQEIIGCHWKCWKVENTWLCWNSEPFPSVLFVWFDVKFPTAGDKYLLKFADFWLKW